MRGGYQELLNKINNSPEDLTGGDLMGYEDHLRGRIADGEEARRQLKELKDALKAAFERMDAEGK